MNQNKQTGFTLIEILVALTILATLTAALTLLVTQVLDAQDQIHQTRTQGQEHLVNFLTRIDRPLSQLVLRQPHQLNQKLGDGSLLLVNNPQELYWVSAGNWILPLQDYTTRLRLWRISFEPENTTLLLQTTGLLDAAEQHDWTLVDSLNNVTAINLTFHHQKKWQNTPPAGQLPKAIRLEITWKNNQYHRLILLPQAIQITASTGSNHE